MLTRAEIKDLRKLINLMFNAMLKQYFCGIYGKEMKNTFK